MRRMVTSPGKTVAVIDIGSNTIKLTVARITGGRIKPIFAAAEVVRLGEGVRTTGRIREDRIDPAVRTLRRFAGHARKRGADQITAVATEATRAAANGPDFLARVKSDVGIDVDVLDGKAEAQLTSEGVLAQINPSGSLLIVDIGGGSTELIATHNGMLRDSISLSIGSGSMTDEFITHDPPSIAELDMVELAAREKIATFLTDAGPYDRMVLVGGTGEFLLAMIGRSGRVEATVLETGRRFVLAVTAAELARVVGMPVARAHVLPAGFAIARSVNRLAAAPVLESVANGLRMGLLLRYARLPVREDSTT